VARYLHILLRLEQLGWHRVLKARTSLSPPCALERWQTLVLVTSSCPGRQTWQVKHIAELERNIPYEHAPFRQCADLPL
jgi:hypothetical protein